MRNESRFKLTWDFDECRDNERAKASPFRNELWDHRPAPSGWKPDPDADYVDDDEDYGYNPEFEDDDADSSVDEDDNEPV